MKWIYILIFHYCSFCIEMWAYEWAKLIKFNSYEKQIESKDHTENIYTEESCFSWLLQKCQAISEPLCANEQHSKAIMSPLLQHRVTKGHSHFQVWACDLSDFSVGQSSLADSTAASQQSGRLHSSALIRRGKPHLSEERPALHYKHQSLGDSREQMEIKCLAPQSSGSY